MLQYNLFYIVIKIILRKFLNMKIFKKSIKFFHKKISQRKYKNKKYKHKKQNNISFLFLTYLMVEATNSVILKGAIFLSIIF
jgi:type III secretory pathway component EscR